MWVPSGSDIGPGLIAGIEFQWQCCPPTACTPTSCTPTSCTPTSCTPTTCTPTSCTPTCSIPIRRTTQGNNYSIY